MRVLLLFLVMTTSAFAQNDFLTANETSRVNRYMDDICPDTYCGGDITFYTKGMSCSGSTCALNLYGAGESVIDMVAANNLAFKTITSAENSKTKIKYYEVQTQREEEIVLIDLEFTCILENLPMSDLAYSVKRDIIYDRVVFECVKDLESTIFDW